ncbi:MAG: hypothetical protein KZQ93_06215 [Candidatus Thiodiazotropha sp. (ex Monitilora ramsayi)]|nr:hypothetical protein [Candidatus Thiodiazotropha sp. (ex Monitilora ramsayi)]
MTDQEVINKRRKMVKYGFVTFIANAVVSIVNPWWPQIAGIDLHFLIAIGIVLFVFVSGSAFSGSTCSSCGKKIYPFWARISGLAMFQHRTACAHCGAQLSEEA